MAQTPVSRQLTRVRTLPTRMRERSWWDDHWSSVLPWIVFAVAFLIWGVVWLVSAEFRANTREAFDVIFSGDQDRLRTYLDGWGAWGPVVSVSLMVMQAILAPIPANILQLVNGIVFGIMQGTLLNIIGQFGGSVLAFTIARSLGKGAVDKLAGRANREEVLGWIYKWGGPALFVIRAIPGLPSDAVSYLCGLTRMPFYKYAIPTLLGYIPQSLFYAWLGNDAASYFWWIVAGGAVFSISVGLVAWAWKKFRTGR